MDNTAATIPTTPTTLSEESGPLNSNSNKSRKRERTTEGEGDVLTLPAKRLTRAKPKLTLDTVMDKLVDMSASMTNQSELLQDLPIIRASIDTVSTEVAAIKATTSQLSTTTTSLLAKTDGLASENEALKRSVSALEARVNQLSSAENANALHHQRAPPGLTNEVTVFGLSFGQVKEADLLSLMAAIVDTLKVGSLPGDFLSARLLRKEVPTLPVNPDQAPNDQPGLVKTSFAVVCKDSATVSRLLAAKRSFGPLKFSQLNLQAPTDAGSNVGQPGDPFVNINELLPTHVIKLLREAKAALKAAGFKFIWVRNFTVFAKYSIDSVVQIINTPADIRRMVQLYSEAQH